MPIEVYYWGMMARGAPIVQILEHTGTEYTYISDMKKFAEVMSKFGASTDCFAPPVVKDGDYIVSQSTAATMYVAKKCGLTPEGYDEYKTMQHIADIVDVFEGNLGKSNEDGPTLKKFLHGDRWKQLMTNLENGIKGPFYFGDKPCAADFFLAAHLDGRNKGVFDPLKERHGEDHTSAYPKVVGVLAALSKHETWANPKGPRPTNYMNPIKTEILDAYHN